MSPPRSFTAPNAGPFTMDGTRSFVVGRGRAAILDPGPADPGHLDALAAAVEGAESVVVLLTHGHADHAEGVSGLLERLRLRSAPGDGSDPEPESRPRGPNHAGEGSSKGATDGDAEHGNVLGAGSGARPLEDGHVVETDEGVLVALETPGHASPHLSFHWPDEDAVFVGDLLLGRGATTWLGAYPGCVADWFHSLERIEALSPSVLHPAHGPDIPDVPATLARFRAHRNRRLEQLRRALDSSPGATTEELVGRIYGEGLPDRIAEATRRSVEAMLHHLRTSGAGPGAPDPTG